MTAALVPFTPRKIATEWTVYTGQSIVDILEHARGRGVGRVYLTGPAPTSGWLFVDTPGWTHGRHFIDSDVPVGRFTHDVTGHAVEIRRAHEWFGAGDYTPADAGSAWHLAGTVHERTLGTGAGLLDSPAATARDVWIRKLRNRNTPPPMLDEETRELIRTTSTQHRIELFRPNEFPRTDKAMRGMWYLDGRFMYSTLTRELGSGPITRLSGVDALHYWRKNQHARARYRITFEVPKNWDTLGVFMVLDQAEDKWHAPRKPGQRFETWVDASELYVGAITQWPIRVHEAIVFTPGRPLDTWTDALIKARLRCAGIGEPDDWSPTARQLAARAFRAILTHGIGAWNSHTSKSVRVAATPADCPPGIAPARHGNLWVWTERTPIAGLGAKLQHPEWSSQVWGRSRARILWSPTGSGDYYAGALRESPHNLVGIRGDAVYLAHHPRWPDDGRDGRLRVKGHIHGPVSWPDSLRGLDNLRSHAETTGPTCEDCTDADY